MSYAREFWIDEVSLSLHTMGLESWTAWNSKIEKTGMIKVIEYSAYEKLKKEISELQDKLYHATREKSESEYLLKEENEKLRAAARELVETLRLYENPFKKEFTEKILEETTIPYFYDDTDFGVFAAKALKQYRWAVG